MAKAKPPTPPVEDDPTEERFEGPTPNGGVVSIAYYLDDDRQLVPKSQATNVEIVEEDDTGDIVFRTYGTLGGATP